ncbi:hypothetical protein [Histidinibacterium lentulum]|uniref:Porin n=1 Tax=Histidinibacterium lentulum TaxID=2480588 RepID=A0A3N2R5U7_9RHOB|nr:hypothetical protein [Histidinibacterium lentulum]ROU02778.1 hypothetical protein EAT49_10710 [Histidinibacterium lentulum]
MTRRLFAVLIAAGTGVASPALAVDVTGGSVTLSYSGLVEEVTNRDGDRADAERRSLSGSAEVELGRIFAVQGDLAFHGYGLDDAGGQSLALHGIVHAMPELSIGLFAGIESLDGRDADFAGIEAVYDFAQGTAEAFYASGQYGGSDGHAMGISGEYYANHWLSFTASAASADFGGRLEVGRAAVGARVALGAVDLTAEYGRADVGFGRFGDDGAFASLGATYTFGFKGGATFEGRSLGALLPGL